ncbi:hypothetical protein QIS74_08851 [Colletotrichum tabaci]|uniref:Uncharacterized protein n=1 Tax=Colletotrichum tabaci TaxID=1209068 RepID=A0AAV9T9E2_9PEZI
MLPESNASRQTGWLSPLAAELTEVHAVRHSPGVFLWPRQEVLSRAKFATPTQLQKDKADPPASEKIGFHGRRNAGHLHASASGSFNPAHAPSSRPDISGTLFR